MQLLYFTRETQHEGNALLFTRLDRSTKKKLPCSAINLLSKVTTHLLHMALKGAQMPELLEVYN